MDGHNSVHNTQETLVATIIINNNSFIITEKYCTACSSIKIKNKEFKDKKIKHTYKNVNTEENKWHNRVTENAVNVLSGKRSFVT